MTPEPSRRPAFGRNSRDVMMFPSPGNYNRLPLEAQGDGLFSYKAVEAKSDVDGEPFYIIFVDPKAPRDPERIAERARSP